MAAISDENSHRLVGAVIGNWRVVDPESIQHLASGERQEIRGSALLRLAQRAHLHGLPMVMPVRHRKEFDINQHTTFVTNVLKIEEDEWLERY